MSFIQPVTMENHIIDGVFQRLENGHLMRCSRCSRPLTWEVVSGCEVGKQILCICGINRGHERHTSGTTRRDKDDADFAARLAAGSRHDD